MLVLLIILFYLRKSSSLYIWFFIWIIKFGLPVNILLNYVELFIVCYYLFLYHFSMSGQTFKFFCRYLKSTLFGFHWRKLIITYFFGLFRWRERSILCLMVYNIFLETYVYQHLIINISFFPLLLIFVLSNAFFDTF